MAAASSTADNRVSSTPRRASDWLPSAVASVYVAGSATGTDATSSISPNSMASNAGR